MKIVVQSPEVLFEHSFFDYLSISEKEDIAKSVREEKSLIVLLYGDDDEEKIFAVFDFYQDVLHVREIAGRSLKAHIGAMEIFGYALCKRYAKKAITVCTSLEPVKWFFKKMGYIDNGNGEYAKAVI